MKVNARIYLSDFAPWECVLPGGVPWSCQIPVMDEGKPWLVICNRKSLVLVDGCVEYFESSRRQMPEGGAVAVKTPKGRGRTADHPFDPNPAGGCYLCDMGVESHPPLGFE